MRRLPIYILIDVSGSMAGEPIQAVQVGLEAMLASLKNDPYALDSVWLSLISFGAEAQVLVPLTELEDFALPTIAVPKTAPTNLGEGLELLCEQYDKEIVKTSSTVKGDWRPLLVVLTDGAPTDVRLYRQMSERVRQNYNFARIICCAAGKDARLDPLKTLTSEIVVLEQMDESSFKTFWVWVSETIGRSSQTPAVAASDIPAPPPPSLGLI